ncbi:MAG: molybdenum cofactor biosynthesis protein MoaE [Acidiferrobacter sp.]
MIRIQTEDFDPDRAAAALGIRGAGACVSFVGTVRAHSHGATVAAIEIEHYPRMTQSELERIATQARHDYGLLDVLIIHRVGRLAAGERIVLVVTWAAHREAAFCSCAAIIDTLKTRVPFWKKEITPDGTHWVPGQSPPAP